MFSSTGRIMLRPRKTDYIMIYVVAAVGVFSGYTIFAPPLKALRDSKVGCRPYTIELA